VFYQWGAVTYFYYKNLYHNKNLNSRRRCIEPLEAQTIMIRIQYKIKQIESGTMWEKNFNVAAVN